MRIYPDKLEADLARSIRPIYLLHGEEPLGIAEAGDRIRAAALQAGFSEREVLFISRDDDWEAVRQSADSMSLFADRKVVDLRLPSGKPGRKGSEVLKALVATPNEDTCFLLTLPKLDRSATASAWFKAIDKAGAHIESRAPTAVELKRWISTRLAANNLSIDVEGLDLLTSHVEGNSLAARQEIEMLTLLHSQQKIGVEEVLNLVTKSARYPLGAAADAALQGDCLRALAVVDGLRDESVPDVLVLWSLTQDIRAGTRLKQALDRGKAQSIAFREAAVWQKRQPLMQQALARHSELSWISMLARAARIDRLIKGMGKGDVWQELAALCVMLSGNGKPAVIDEDIVAGSTAG